MTPPCHGRIVLGPEELALLTRLRAIALLFQMGRTVRRDLGDVYIALWIAPTSHRIYPAELGSRAACRLVAEAAGWDALLQKISDASQWSSFFDETHERMGEAEGLHPPPLGLARLMTQLRVRHTMSVTSATTLRHLGWDFDTDSATLFPILPTTVSAHEALDALLSGQPAGGLGSGPLGRLAAEAAAVLARGAP